MFNLHFERDLAKGFKYFWKEILSQEAQKSPKLAG